MEQDPLTGVLQLFQAGARMRLDKEKAGKIADGYEAKAKKTRSLKQKEKLRGRAFVFRMIEATLGPKPFFMKRQWRSGASRHA
jgi:hypothetical protein